MSYPQYPDPPLPATEVHIEGYVWIENQGQVNFVDNNFAGTRGQSLRMEGFQIGLVNPPPNLAIQYRVYISNLSWMSWIYDNTYAGTQGLGLGMQAFAIRLVGDPQYHVQYMAHQETSGDIPEYGSNVTDLVWVGDPGSGLRLEGMALTIVT
jgi:uncharacterized protein YjdB